MAGKKEDVNIGMRTCRDGHIMAIRTGGRRILPVGRQRAQIIRCITGNRGSLSIMFQKYIKGT